MSSLLRATGPFQHDNVRRYVWFTIAFHARFYYPILAILFLDLGLSMEQFVTLNAIWAVTIFLVEVPSGALADLVGRRRLLTASGVLMILEMAALLFAPRDGGLLLFSFCAINRILSGLAEAAASGADEALAYDSLDEESNWDQVLETSMRWRSAAMVLAVIAGAALYDDSFVGRFIEISPEATQRIPIILCLIQAVMAFFISLGFRELETSEEKKATLREILHQTWKAALWVFTTRAALVLVLGAVIIDSVTRNFATVNSEYYRLISLPAYSFGFIAAGAAALGMLIPRLSRLLASRFSPLVNLTFTAVWVILALILLVPAWPYWGLLPAFMIMVALVHLGFIVSRFLNQITESSQRATVLSVKGLIFNLGYGTMSLLFAGVVALERKEHGEQAFVQALAWQPWAFAAVFVIFLLWASGICKLRTMKNPIH